MIDGTYTIDDVQTMHAVIEAAIDSVERVPEKKLKGKPGEPS